MYVAYPRTTPRNVLLAAFIACLLFAQFVLLLFSAFAQAPAPSRSPTTPSTQAKDPDSQIVTSVQAPANDDLAASPHDPNASPAQKADEAWSILTTAVTDPKHPELRIQALAALGMLGTNPRSTGHITTALDDKDLDVRTAAILAAGETHNRNLTTALRTMLDDKEPQVAFAAAVTLWKMNDRSGEDILIAVADGDRSANPTMVKSTGHKLGRSLHHPSDLARLGALQGATMLLGPFGFGVTAYEYARKNGGDSARVTAIEQLAQEKTEPIREELIAALDDKDLTVRTAAAKALGSYRDRTVSNDLFNLFIDPKAPVRLTAAAAYINSTQPPSSRKTAAKR
jgi:HEAT repeat protein